MSVHQGPVEAMSAIIEPGQAPTMDNLVSAPQCATLLTCAYVPHLGSTFSVPFLAHSTSAAKPLLVPGQERCGPVRPRLMLVYLWPLHAWPMYMPSYRYMPSPRCSRNLCKLSLKSLPGNAKIWRLESFWRLSLSSAPAEAREVQHMTSTLNFNSV